MANRIFSLGLVASVAASPTLLKRDNTTMVYSFKDVPITSNIQYIPCYDKFTCTQLEVPLDYDDLSAGTTNIAFIKHSAPQQPAMGDIIYNPGGPGGSSIGDVPLGLPRIVALLGDSYNIVGMDPRGVNNSGPLLDCFGGKPWLRDYFINKFFFDVDPLSEASFSNYYEMTGAFGTWCTQNLNETAKYVNTPATARDMLQYAELLAESQDKPREEAKVNYYGISYGTVLGTTFAALYPDRVGKFLIDGVVDGNDYYFGNWSQGPQQADAAVESFFTLCAEAGEACAFKGNSSTAEEIKERFDGILEDLEKNPIPVTDPHYVVVPTTVTHMDFRNFLTTSLYRPATVFPILATLAAGLEKRDGRSTASVTGKGIPPTGACDYRPLGYDSTFYRQVIACNDNNHNFEITKESLTELFKYERTQSTYIGDVWSMAVIPQCRNLDISSPASQIFPGYKNVKTSTPILFGGNLIDPATSSYELMSSYFEGSRVLLQDAIGHALISTTSNCTASYVQRYFKTGELPPKDTVCETDFKVFSSALVVEDAGLVTRHSTGRRAVDML